MITMQTQRKYDFQSNTKYAWHVFYKTCRILKKLQTTFEELLNTDSCKPTYPERTATITQK